MRVSFQKIMAILARHKWNITMERKNDYCIILAGGVGRRLWPCSRKDLPKQFLDFFGTGRTLLQQTYDRFVRFIPAENIYISTFADYVEEVHAQLPDVPFENILGEPVQLSTAPAASWASYHIALRHPDAAIVITPSDQHIVSEERFAEQLCAGLDFVRANEVFLSVGVKATQPNTGYGYIQRGEELIDGKLSRVKSFTEKPDTEYARMFVESGEFLWNTGLFLWHVRTMSKLMREPLPDMAKNSTETGRTLTPKEELDWIVRYYPAAKYRSIDLVILGETQPVYVQECDFGWADIGCWPELYKTCKKDADGNAVMSRSHVMFSGCSDNLVKLPDGMAAVIKGLDGYLVAQDGNVLVICPNDDPALMRRLVNEVQLHLGEEYA